jgi:transcriptional/translational regulatory protein YebC/TACO1
MFDQKGVISVSREHVDEETLLEAALEAGAEDVSTEAEDVFRIITAPTDLHGVVSALETAGIPVLEAVLDRLAQNTKELGEQEAERFLKFYETLEEQDDVQKLFANFEISDDVMERLGN